MGLTGNGKSAAEKLAAKLRKLQKRDEGARQRVTRESGKQLRAVVRAQIASGESPYGETWPRTTRGYIAFSASNRVSGSIKLQVLPETLRFYSPIDWLVAHQRGHKFRSRSIVQRIAFNRFGARTLIKKLGKTGLLQERYIRQGARELPARPLLPTAGSGLPRQWGEVVRTVAREEIRGALT